MKNFLTRYRPRYIRSLVYMMQASEYNAGDFLRWFRRTRDFLGVEERKTLVLTPKALIFLGVGYVSVLFLFAVALLVPLVGTSWWKYTIFILIVLSLPYILSYGMALFLILGRFVQWPVEQGLIALANRKLKTHKGLRIAIAGSYGKTSMREILKTVLSAGKVVAAPPGSHNTPLGISSFIRGLKGDEEVLVFEMGEYYRGDVKRLCAMVQPDIGIITGVNEAHLEKFKEVERTRETVFELAEYLHASDVPAKEGASRKPLYINGENEVARNHAPAEAILYSREGVGRWRVDRAQTGLLGTSFTFQTGKENISVRSHLLGLHQVGPLVAAAHLASKLGLTMEQIEKGIDATKPFSHRLEQRVDAHGVTILDDSYNGNPDGVRAVIEFLATIRGSRRWYVTPGLVEMGSRKEDVHKEIGRELAKAGIEKVVLMRNSVTPFIETGLQEGKYQGEIVWFEKALDAFSALPNLTVKGDVVLLQNDWPDQYV